MFNLLIKLMPDDSADSVAVQKQILKIFFALTQYVLPLDLISRYTIFLQQNSGIDYQEWCSEEKFEINWQLFPPFLNTFFT